MSKSFAISLFSLPLDNNVAIQAGMKECVFGVETKTIGKVCGIIALLEILLFGIMYIWLKKIGGQVIHEDYIR